MTRKETFAHVLSLTHTGSQVSTKADALPNNLRKQKTGSEKYAA